MLQPAKKSRFRITPRIQLPVVIFQFVMGSTLGLYVYTFGDILFNRLKGAGLPEPDALFWTAAVFTIGLLLELPFEILTGVFADGLGRKFSVVVSLVFRALFFGALIGLALFAVPASEFAGSVGTGKAALVQLFSQPGSAVPVISVAIASVTLFALHYTLQSGSFDAWMAGSLDEQAHVETNRPLTDSEANERAACLTKLSFRGEFVFDLAQLFGTLAGVYYNNVLKLPSAAFLCGAALCVFGASACSLYMRENRGLFARPREMLTSRRFKLMHKMWDLTWISFHTFRRDVHLLVSFAAMAAFMSLIYLVDLMWVVYSENTFAGFRENLYLFVAALIVTSMLGNVISAWYFERRKDLRSLIWLNCVLNFAFAIPMFALVWFSSNNMPVFLVLMGSHRMFAGATLAAGKALRNSLIKPGSSTTATMLSIGQMFSNLCIASLVLLWIGEKPNSIQDWQYPAMAVLVTVTIMTYVLLRYPHRRSRNNSRRSLTGKTE